MKKRLTVRVTAKDIREGDRHNIRFCPVAIAISRVLKSGALVGDKYWRRQIGFLEESEHPLPAKVSKWIKQFDAGQPVEPISFEVEWR